jgi:hypothetical protein
LAFVSDTVRAGKVTYVGLSNFIGWHLKLALSTAQQHLHLDPAVTQQLDEMSAPRSGGLPYGGFGSAQPPLPLKSSAKPDLRAAVL